MHSDYRAIFLLQLHIKVLCSHTQTETIVLIQFKLIKLLRMKQSCVRKQIGYMWRTQIESEWSNLIWSDSPLNHIPYRIYIPSMLIESYGFYFSRLRSCSLDLRSINMVHSKAIFMSKLHHIARRMFESINALSERTSNHLWWEWEWFHGESESKNNIHKCPANNWDFISISKLC